MDESLIIFTCQIISCILLVVMYIPQVLKIAHRHSAGDISLPYNYLKMMLTVVSALVLTLSNNSLIIIVAQYVSLALSSVVLVQIVYYSYKTGNTKQVNIMYVAVAIFIGILIALLNLINDTTLIIYILQVSSFVVMFFQYFSQIFKTAKSKSVGDISIAHWLCKLIYTILAILILCMSHNCIIVTLTQIFNLVFTTIIFAQCMKYKEA